jgi:enamine deaminase RidA (YjgF/YER057c/UK114 family)
MGSSQSGTRQREGVIERSGATHVPKVLAEASRQTQIINHPSKSRLAPQYSVVELENAKRVSVMLTSESRGSFSEQVQEILSKMQGILDAQEQPMVVVTQTVFLRRAEDQPECERLFAAYYRSNAPVTNFVWQPPCCGADLALEAWAIGGASVQVEHFGPHALSVSYDSVRWVYCAGIHSTHLDRSAYPLATDVLERMGLTLAKAGSGFEHVVRTWFYLGGITEPEAGTQRYKELNRARTDFYRPIRFPCSLSDPMIPQGIYPASTGIGTGGMGLVASCLSLQTKRKDACLLPLENPHQTPAYAYHPRYSPQSPKFSRGMALLVGNHVITWVSGTASVVNSQSCYLGDIEKQTEQAISNIERLIAPENFAFHGLRGAGATLGDLAKIRVYLKRREDFERCKAICDRRFGPVPAIYAVADICRPELLVEIEGAAFSSRC